MPQLPLVQAGRSERSGIWSYPVAGGICGLMFKISWEASTIHPITSSVLHSSWMPRGCSQAVTCSEPRCKAMRNQLGPHGSNLGYQWSHKIAGVWYGNVWECYWINLNHIESSSIFWYKFTLMDETVSPTKSNQNLGGQLQLWTCPWSRTEESERPHWRTCVSLARHASRVAGPPANASPSKSSENPVKDLRCYSKWNMWRTLSRWSPNTNAPQKDQHSYYLGSQVAGLFGSRARSTSCTRTAERFTWASHG